MDGNKTKQMMTNSHDLQSLLSSCKKCSQTVCEGKNIISQYDLPFTTIDPNFALLAPIAFIVLIHDSSQPTNPGHWVCLLVSLKSKFIILCDGLNYATQNHRFMHDLRLFSKRHNLSLVNLGIRYQQNDTNYCGQLAVSIICAFSEMRSRSFKALISLLKRNSIKTNELYLLKYVQKHLHFKI